MEPGSLENALSDAVFIYHFGILIFMQFCIHFDFLNYCIKIGLILIVEFWCSLNLCTKASAHSTHPSPGFGAASIKQVYVHECRTCVLHVCVCVTQVQMGVQRCI